jgi:hypothetical protein
MRLTVTPESRCYGSNSWLVGCLARLPQFFIASAAQRWKFASQDSKEKRGPFIKGHGGDIPLRMIDRPGERVKRKEFKETRDAAAQHAI